MELVDEIIVLGLDILDFMESCIQLGFWWEVQNQLNLNCNIDDVIFTIWGMGRNYLDQNMDNVYIAIMLTLKDMIKHFQVRTERRG